MVIKRGASAPTIPVSTDHRNGDWLDTDIYEGELYQDTTTGIMYTRLGSLIRVVGGAQKATYKALLTQTGTSAPAVQVKQNELSGTLVWTRSAQGVYHGTLTGEFGADETFVMIQNRNETSVTSAQRISANVIEVRTTDTAFALQDALLTSTSILIEVFV
jgi:hypothetical protein